MPVAIKMGFGDYGSKHDRLRHMISHLNREGQPVDFQVIDLHDVDRVVVKPHGAGKAGKHSVAHRGERWKCWGKEV